MHCNANKPTCVKANEAMNVESPNSENVYSKIPDIVPVYATATIESCPNQVINDEYKDSLRRFMHCEPHLQENIVSIELKHLSTRSQTDGKFVHTMTVVMHVRTSRLWECPAKYVRKHLGLDNYWTRSNGTVVRMTRIHRK